MNRSLSPDILLSHAAFEKLRQSLLSNPRHEVLDQPLAFLATALDRNLPLALLDRTVNDILAMPFEVLYDTPSVGPKKMLGLIHLLKRGVVAGNGSGDGAPTIPFEIEPQRNINNSAPDDTYRPTEMAEEIWGQWRSKVARFNLGEEPLGRFARTLHDLPRSAWHTPLSFYYQRQLSEILALPTHGHKRMAAVFKVFEDLHRVLSNTKTPPHLSISVLPRLVNQVEHWAIDASLNPIFPSRQEVEVCLVQPLIGQIQIDADQRLVKWMIHELVPDRIALSRRSADIGCSADLSRFNRQKICDIVQIRWPSGDLHVRSLFGRESGDCSIEDREYFHAIVQLFFGNSSRPLAPKVRHRTLVEFKADMLPTYRASALAVGPTKNVLGDPPGFQ